MIYPDSDISKSLATLGFNKSDTVMIHGDAGLAAQYQWESGADPTLEFIKSIVDYFNDGTVIVPTFTYSATKGEVYSPSTTPSTVGLFSEKFRSFDRVVRSRHSIFSIGCIGEQANYFLNSSTKDCFGADTFFDKLFLKNVKILAIGCSLERATFVHYVEQKLDVSYRYFKNFEGKIQDEGGLEKETVRYFVRDLDIDTALDFQRFEDVAISQNKLIKGVMGRFPARQIAARDFFDIASNLIKTDPYALIKEEYCQ